METRKVNLDRKKISSEEIQQKQDWNSVLGEARRLQPPLSKKVWFYGPATLASIGALVSVTLFANSESKDLTEVPKTSKVQELKTNVEVTSIEIAKINEESIQNEVKLIKEKESEKKILLKEEIRKEFVEQTTKKLEPTEPKVVNETVLSPIVKKQEDFVEPKYIFASINEKIGGRISIKEIEDNPLINLNSKSSMIQSFDLTYYNGFDDVTRKVEGAEIPEEVIEEMKISGINSSVYITKVVCFSVERGSFLAPSFSFNLVGK